MSTIDNLLDNIPIPKMVTVEQRFERPIIVNIEEELLTKLAAANVLAQIRLGQTVAIAVGSRGISNQPLMIKVLVAQIKNAGGKPFIVPAMGSHGGATAAGQKSMLIDMGITEDYVEAPIKASMEVIQIGVSENGLPVYVDKYACEADAIVIINRIKPHVAFRGKVESGLMKMITIGLGKQKGADICHELGPGKMVENILAIARVTLAKTNLLFGIGIIENAYHETCRIEVLSNQEIEAKEPELQAESKRLAPKIYFDNLDVLIIDEIGKEISGTGFDTGIVGRYHTPCISGGPSITRVAVLDITDKSHGNANGLGIVDFTTRRAYEKMDFEQTYLNAITNTVPNGVKIPMVLKSDRQVIQAAIKTCNILDKEQVRMIRIKNTIALSKIEVSESLLPEVRTNPYLEIVGPSSELHWDKKDNLF
jgi:hypothetical protein